MKGKINTAAQEREVQRWTLQQTFLRERERESEREEFKGEYVVQEREIEREKKQKKKKNIPEPLDQPVGIALATPFDRCRTRASAR
jgi:hypothetical protein